MHNLLTNDDTLCTPAEREADEALSAARPNLAPLHAGSLRRARMTNLAKLHSALNREGFADSVPPVLPEHPVALIDVMAARAGSRRPEHWARLRGEVAASVAAHALALVAEEDRRGRLAAAAGTADALDWAARRADEQAGFSPLAVFEQSVVDGHPWHPCARMRVGMGFDEVLGYTPEWADEVAVELVAVEHGVDDELTATLRRTYPALAARADARLAAVAAQRGATAPPRGPYTLLPVHPWQLRHVVPDRYRPALADQRIVVVPGAELPARPLMSVRTFAPAHDRRAPHLKTAMSVQLTSAVRIVSPAAVHNGPRLSRLLQQIAAREAGFGGRFVILSELAAGRYRPPADEAVDGAAGLGAIVRESPERHAGPGEVALPVAALTARSPLRERPLVADALARIGGPPGEAARRFLGAFCDCALGPLFTLLSRWGIALEAHGQNTVVVLRDGLPTRLVYRDLGGVRVDPARLARGGLTPPDLAGSLTSEREDELRAKLFGALVSTSLAELVPALSRVAGIPVAGLWGLVARRCAAAYQPLLDDRAAGEQARRDLGALLGPTMPMKALLRMRLADDPLAEQWMSVRNPLAEAA